MELTESKDFFQAVFNSAASGIAVMQPIYTDTGRIEDFSILLFNRYLLKRIGDLDYAGKRYSDVFPVTKESGILEKFITAGESGVTARFEGTYAVEDRTYWFWFTAVKHGELLVVTVEDITERKHAQAALSEALDKAERQERLYDSVTNNTPDLVYVFDLDYNFTYANKALLTMWGKSAEDAIGLGLRENGYEEWHAQMHEREIDEIIATKKSIRGTVSFPHAELGSRIYDYILVPVVNGKGEVEAVAGTTRDITDIKRAEENLQRSEARFRSMLQEAPVAATLFRGPDLIIEIANELTQEYWYKDKEIIGKPLAEAAPELEDQQMLALLRDIYQRGGTANFSESPITFVKDGVSKEGYYSFSVKALYDHKGNVDGILSIGVDVTEQVTARKKLEESESRFRALVNASSDVIYSLNSDWTIMRPLDGRGFLLDANEPLEGWMEINVHPLDLEIVKKTISRSIANKSVFELEHRVVRVDGTPGWTFSRAIPILDDQNNIIEWFGSAADITAQKEVQEIIKESEEKFRQMADLVPQIIWTSRADGLIDYYNKRWYEYTGLEEKEFTDQSWIHIMHPDDVPLLMRSWNTSVQKGTPFQLEFRLKNIKTDEYHWFLSKGLPIRDKAGIITKWFGASTDIQEQKTLTEKLESLVAERTIELQRSNGDLQQFAHVVSHDLKEPVRKIKTFIGRLEEHLNGKLDESATRFIEKIHVATDRIYTMIDGVLAYSTTNANKEKSELVDLNEVLKNIETDLEIPLQKTGGMIQYHNLPILEGAPVLLYQLFYNLVNNSIKFAKAGVPPQIAISSETAVQHNAIVSRISLQDNGIGFDPDMSEQIFETFARLNSKDKYEGTGLGLSLCKKITERHGGSIIATGTRDQGATFIITLPLQQIKAGI